MNLLIPITGATVFLIWFLYKIIATREVKTHLYDLFASLFFFGTWTAIHLMIAR